MQLTIEIDGRPRQVRVERVERGVARARAAVLRIEIDGRAYEVDAVALDRGALSLILVEDARRASHEVLTAPGRAAGELDVSVAGRAVTVALNGRARRSPAGGGAATGASRVTAPMPGKVLRVLVNAGDQVEAGQALVVVEAMKMENELRSPRAGTVKQVEVQAGASVEAGRLLVVVE